MSTVSLADGICVVGFVDISSMSAANKSLLKSPVNEQLVFKLCMGQSQ